MTEQLSPLALQALAIVEESGAIISANHAHPHTIRHKGRIDLVTETDIAVEAFLKERLATLTPEAGFLAEESAEDLSLPDTCWIIDPVDGTTNFAHGLPLTVTSVAYRLNGEIVLGIVNAPLLRECFIAEKGKGAWRNGERISVSSVAACENALVSTGFPYEIARRVDEILERMRPVLSSCQGDGVAGPRRWISHGRPAGASTLFMRTNSNRGTWPQARCSSPRPGAPFPIWTARPLICVGRSSPETRPCMNSSEK